LGDGGDIGVLDSDALELKADLAPVVVLSYGRTQPPDFSMAAMALAAGSAAAGAAPLAGAASFFA
jgi:hypothetical protein